MPAEVAAGRGLGFADSEGEAETQAEGEDTDAIQVPCHIFLPVVPAARVIGKGGASIRAIRERSGATVRVLQKELPAEMQRREDRVAVLEGTQAQIREAIASVLERVFDRSGLPDTAAGRSKDRPHMVEVLVPEKSGPHLIGQRGERIRALIEETNCDLDVLKEPMAGLADQKRVRVTGSSVEEAIGAVWRLHEVLSELVAGGVLRPEHFELREAAPGAGTAGLGGGGSPGVGAMGGYGGAGAAGPRNATNGAKEAPIRLLVAQDEAAWIVGKRGNKITKLRDLAKVQMNDADSPPFEQSERFLEISGASLEQRLRVVQLVLEDLATRQEASPAMRILVPTEHFGSVMGHKGETIRRMMQTTGARVQQHKAERLEDGKEYRLRLVEVEGDAHQRLEVVRHIHLAVETRGRTDAAPAGVAAAGSGHGTSLGAGGLMGSGNVYSGLLAGPAGAPAPADCSSGAACDDLAGRLSLQLAMPSEEVARMLASDASGIAWRAGVRLTAARGPGGVPILQVVGTAVGNSVACYLIQDRLFMMH